MRKVNSSEVGWSGGIILFDGNYYEPSTLANFITGVRAHYLEDGTVSEESVYIEIPDDEITANPERYQAYEIILAGIANYGIVVDCGGWLGVASLMDTESIKLLGLDRI